MLRRPLAGFVVIVVGVMVALAGDEWVESLEENRRGEELAARVAADLRADSIQIESFIAIANDGLASVERVILAVETGLQIPDDSLAAVLRAASGIPSWPRVQSATYVEMISTGSLALLPDSLRTVIVDYYEFVDWVVTQSPRTTWDFAPWVAHLPTAFFFNPSFEISPSRLRTALSASPEVIPKSRAIGIITTYFLDLCREFLQRATAALRVAEGY